MKSVIQKNSLLLGIFMFLVVLENSFAELPKATQEEIKELKEFVESGVAYIKQNGIKKAFAEFNKPKGQGKFWKGDLYFFGYDYKGKCYVHPLIPKRIGKDFYTERAAYGIPVIRLLAQIAKTGGHFLNYYWLEPTTNKVSPKTAYVVDVENKYYIGSGVYNKVVPIPSQMLEAKSEEIKAFINAGIEYYKEHGQEAAFKEFNNPKGAFRIGDKYLFVLDTKGVFYADGAESARFVGKNMYELKDEFDTKFVQLMIAAGKNGEEGVSYYWQEPSTGKIKLKVCYIKPLTGDLLIGSGFYGD